MSLKYPPLKALRAFESAARTGSYVDAAGELNVTPAAVSQQVRNLERYYARRLFTRYNNRIVLTDAGSTIYSSLAPALLDLAHKNRELLDGPSAAHLVISVLPSLAQTWLVSLIARFAAQYPNIGLHTRVEEDPVDLTRLGIDLRITYGDQLYADFATRELFRDAVLPMCSHDFAARHPEIDEDLAHLPDQRFVHTVWGDRFASHPTWADWFRYRQTARDPVIASGQQVSMSSVGLEYAAAGMGVILGQQRLAETWLRDGRLIALTTDSLPLGQSYFALHPHSRREPVLLDALLDILDDEVRRS